METVPVATAQMLAIAERVTVFSVIATPRSGSTLLYGLLDSHPELLCHYELFHPNEIALSLRFAERIADTSARAAGPLAFLDDLLGRYAYAYPQARALGFKVLLSPLQIETALTPVATCRSIRKIVLDRRNRLAAYASVWTAMNTGLWQSQQPRPQAGRLLHFDEAHFTAYVEGADSAMARVSALLGEQDPLVLDYTDVVGPCLDERVLTFLEVSPAQLETSWVKTGPSCPLDAFDNPERVVAFVRASGRDEWLRGG